MRQEFVPREQVLSVVAHGPEAWHIQDLFVTIDDAGEISSVRGTLRVLTAHCRDHFKRGYPAILPAAFTVELVCQLATYPILLKFPGRVPLLGEFRAKPLAAVFPGDLLELRAELVEMKGMKGRARGEAFVGGKKIFEVEFEFRLAHPKVFAR